MIAKCYTLFTLLYLKILVLRTVSCSVQFIRDRINDVTTLPLEFDDESKKDTVLWVSFSFKFSLVICHQRTLTSMHRMSGYLFDVV